MSRRFVEREGQILPAGIYDAPPAADDAPAIEIVGLTKTFGTDRAALDNVSLAIRRGEMVALIGASGSGKSTLLRHVAGLVRGDRPKTATPCCVNVFGTPIQANGRIAARVRASRARIGFIFQQFNLVNRLSVLTNVLIGNLGRIPAWRGTLGLFTRAEKQRAMEALARVGIADVAARRAATLSGGQQQRAAIARALVQRAEVILADEPIASLDPASSERVMASLADINRQDGTTLVVSLHQVEFAVRYCHRAVAMRDGAVVFDGPTTALTPAFLQTLYGDDSEELVLGGHAGIAARTADRPAADRRSLEFADPALALARS